MSVTDIFMAYAADFEASFVDDDWTRVKEHFADDAVYQVKGLSAFECKLTGPAAITAGFKKSLDTLDRKLDDRTIEVVSDIDATADSVAMDWKVTYTKEGAPPFELYGHSYGRVVGGKIVELVDSYTPEMEKAAAAWVGTYGRGLSGSYV